MRNRVMRAVGASIGGLVVAAALPMAVATAEPATSGNDDTAATVLAPPETGAPAASRAAAHAGKVCVPLIGFLGDMRCVWK